MSGYSVSSNRRSNNSHLSDVLMAKDNTSLQLDRDLHMSKTLLKKQIDYKFKSKNGQMYSRLAKMKKLVKNIFFRYPNEDIVFSIFPMKGQIESKSFKEIEIYCFGKKKLKLKDKLIIGRVGWLN
jgi:cytochrome c oxidase assembly protein Cox11